LTVFNTADYRGALLPPAPYSIVKQVGGRGMYSFACVREVCPCATNPEGLQMAGLHQRDQAYNGIVVELKLDFIVCKIRCFGWNGIQKYRTKRHLAGETQRVPAQRMIDFTQSRVSSN
jgi:hypothetical protein